MKKFLAAIALVAVIMPVVAFAQTTNGCSGSVSADPTNLPKCVNQIYIWSIGVAALLAVVMIVFGGYLTISSAGNAQRAAKGREFIWSSLIGLALLFGAYVLLNTINPDLVNLKAPTLTPTPPPTTTTP